MVILGASVQMKLGGEKMNAAIEKKIVNTFVYRNRRERVLFELGKREKRDDLLWQFERYLDPSYMHRIRTHIKDAEHLYGVLKEEGAENECYVLADGRSYDDKIPLMRAIEENLFRGPYFMLLGDGLAYFESEPYVMSERYILRKG